MLALSTTAKAQNPYLNSANAQLRSVFSQISFPSPSVKFLYDRSAKLSDSTFYQNNSPDTLDFDEWLQIYDEMYYAAHDTVPLTTNPQLFNYSNNYGNDTIPIGIMDYDWFYCSGNSLTSNIYFNFDTINNILTDKVGRPGWPFGQANIFAVAPLRMSTSYINPTFRIDPNLFFIDGINGEQYKSTSFRLDFGDGTGWHYFNPNTLAHYSVNYPNIGDYQIQAELLDLNNSVIKKSKSKINIAGKATSNSADEVLDMPGLNVGVFHSCNPDIEKVIIYLEGIDLLDMLKSQNRNIDVIYEDMIHSQYIEELRNFNYAFYVVDWKNSRIDIRFNALYVVNLIEKLKNDYKYSDEQFVIIGESMGGLVARYALSFMESKDYLSGSFSRFFVESLAPENQFYLATHPYLTSLGVENRNSTQVHLLHKTRELITIDSPHQGANIPISLQLAYNKAFGGLSHIINPFANLFNLGLGSYAVRQMLYYHISGKLFVLSPISPYSPANEYFTFFSDLEELGNYPKFAKLMALSSGALDGTSQINPFTGNYRIPNDLLFNIGTYKEYKMFGKTHPLFDAALTLKTNPNGSGNVYKAYFYFYIPYISLKFWKIQIKTLKIKLIDDNETVQGVRPYCTYSGGNLQYNVAKQNVSFGFIPVQSALDYGNGLNMPLYHNIEAENINTKLSRTPFHVIMGYPNGINANHLNYRDEGAFNISQTNAINCNSGSNEKYTYFDAANQNLCDVKRGLLNLEIGDEEIYLENWTLNRKALFQAQFDVRVNERNPYYEYPSTINTPLLNYKGIYSKQNDFQITSTGYAKFFHNQNPAVPTSVGFSYTNPLNTSLWGETQMDMFICTNDYSTKSMIFATDPSDISSDENKIGMLVYPNPSDASSVFVRYQLNNQNLASALQLVDATGKILKNIENLKGEDQEGTAFDLLGLEQGIYFIRIFNAEEQMTERLIIK